MNTRVVAQLFYKSVCDTKCIYGHANKAICSWKLQFLTIPLSPPICINRYRIAAVNLR